MNPKLAKKFKKKGRRKLIGAGLLLVMKTDLILLAYNPCSTELIRFKAETPKKDDWRFLEKLMVDASTPAPRIRRKARKRYEQVR